MHLMGASTGEAAASGCGWPLHVVDEAAHAPHIETPSRFASALAALLAVSAVAPVERVFRQRQRWRGG